MKLVALTEGLLQNLATRSGLAVSSTRLLHFYRCQLVPEAASTPADDFPYFRFQQPS